MALGVGAAFRIVAAIFQIIADSLNGLAECAEYAGDPEISTVCAVVVAVLLVQGRWVKAVIALVLISGAEFVLTHGVQGTALPRGGDDQY